jgi:hypothetical protein
VTRTEISGKIRLKVHEAYFWNFFYDNPAGKPFQNSCLAYARRPTAARGSMDEWTRIIFSTHHGV